MKKIFLFAAALITITSCNHTNNNSDAYGSFEATEIIISAEANGKIMELKINEGEFYNSGTIIGYIDTTDIYLKLLQLQAQRNAVASKISNILTQIDVQKQQKENLIIEKNRLENLLKDNAATQKQLDDINGNIRMIDKQMRSIESQNVSVVSEVKAMDYQIAQLRENIKKCYFHIPVDGTILCKYAQRCEFITLGKPIFKIADIREMTLKAYVSGAQLPNVKIGDSVEVWIDKDEENNTRLNGTVTWIASNAEFTPKIIQTKDERVNLVYAVKIKVINDGSIKIGMPGEVKFKKS